MPNPFFSGRIPIDLHERVEQYISETGESKTQVLINALAAYLNYPIVRPTLNSVNLEEKFKALEERITTLETSFKKSNDKSFVVNNENKKSLEEANTCDNTDNKTDNKFSAANEALESLWEKGVDNNFDKNSDNKAKNTFQNQEEPIRLLPEYVPSNFEKITSAELIKQTSLRRTQLDGYKRRLIDKLLKMEQPLGKRKLLEVPEKVETRNPTMVNGYPHDLFYLGENEKGKSLWSILPYDNKRYQQLSM